MAGIVVCGGGVCGLATAMLLARDGHEVTVLERDPAPPPEPGDAWDEWERRGVNQFRLAHFLLPRFHEVAKAELPEVVTALDRAGAHRFNMLSAVSEGAFPPDPRFDVITARRPVVEAAVASVAQSHPGVTVRRGVAIAALVPGPSTGGGIPHVAGVETDGGERIAADLVVDATGRRSPLPRWLTALGARAPLEEEEDSGFVYYGRHVRSRDGQPVVPAPSNVRVGSVSLLALPADDCIAGVGVIASANDAALRVLRHEEPWRRVVGLLPGGDRILECEPVSPLVSMAKIEDRWRRYVVAGQPVATGVLAVADAWAATNPSRGRGISLGLLHAVALRDTLREVGVDDPLALACAFDEVTEQDFTPWYRSTVWLDRCELAMADAAIDGEEVDWSRDPLHRDWLRLPVVGMEDPAAVMPRFAASLGCLDQLPEDLLRDPDIRARLEASDAEPPTGQGPSREELLSAAGDVRLQTPAR